jgi:hypothetical protein
MANVNKIANKISDFSYLARSHDFVNPADGTYDIIRLPKNAFVEDVFIDVFDLDANGTVTVGFSGNGAAADPDGFIDATLGVTSAVAIIRATDDAQPASKGKWFHGGSGMLTVTTANINEGSFRVFVKYSIVS